MNKIQLHLTIIAVAGLVAAGTAFAQDAPPPGEGWVSLFNGKDLTGWQEVLQEHDGTTRVLTGDERSWTVIDGVLDFGGKGGHLLTQKKYGSYILRLEWRFKTDMCPMPDSGVILRGLDPKPASLQHVQLWSREVGSGGLWGAVAPQPPLHADKPQGEWNAMEITLKKTIISVLLNGQATITDFDFKRLPPQGEIGFQAHGGLDPRTGKFKALTAAIQVRNIWIKELPN